MRVSNSASRAPLASSLICVPIRRASRTTRSTAVRGHIVERYGNEYLPDRANFYRSGKSAQDAHEAIRPTAVERDPESLARYLAKDELALYTLIYNRFVSSQMNPAVYDRTTVDIESGTAVFRATGQVMKFDGFMRVYLEGQDEAADDDDVATLPSMTEGERLTLVKPLAPTKADERGIGFDLEQHFTQPPPRFTQATLIKELEDKGIGRPSTYASIMASILSRDYVEEDESKRMRPTSLGRVVCDLLITAFPDILEVGFTAGIELQLDGVEDGKENWVKTLKRFWGPFEKRLGEAKKLMPEVKRKGLETGLKCELDGGNMVIKWGRNGEFLACSNYPKCTNTSEFKRDEQGNIMPQESTAPDRLPTRFARNVASRWCAGVRASASSSDARAIQIVTVSSAPARNRSAPAWPAPIARRATSSNGAAAEARFSTVAAAIQSASSPVGTASYCIRVPIAARPIWSRKPPSATALGGNVRTRSADISSRPPKLRPPRSRSSHPPRPSPNPARRRPAFRSAFADNRCFDL